mmetsp:Transcript_1904/g.4828  ORF Transcript_1904/g.4828 Transcript_1904/m.4828 type:complete len:393 (-) Transcript_1904:816-1994(-)
MGQLVGALAPILDCLARPPSTDTSILNVPCMRGGKRVLIHMILIHTTRPSTAAQLHRSWAPPFRGPMDLEGGGGGGTCPQLGWTPNSWHCNKRLQLSAFYSWSGGSSLPLVSGALISWRSGRSCGGSVLLGWPGDCSFPPASSALIGWPGAAATRAARSSAGAAAAAAGAGAAAGAVRLSGAAAAAAATAVLAHRATRVLADRAAAAAAGVTPAHWRAAARPAHAAAGAPGPASAVDGAAGAAPAFAASEVGAVFLNTDDASVKRILELALVQLIQGSEEVILIGKVHQAHVLTAVTHNLGEGHFTSPAHVVLEVLPAGTDGQPCHDDPEIGAAGRSKWRGAQAAAAAATTVTAARGAATRASAATAHGGLHPDDVVIEVVAIPTPACILGI